MNRLDFSVIIPARNEEANIERCLDSIFHVEWDKGQYEVIVVDNGSTDRTVAIAREKGAAVFVKPELTISGLRNFGAGEAKGEVFAFLDADCTVHPFWLREAAKYMMREDIVCFGSPPHVPPESSWVQRAWYQVRRKNAELGTTRWLESMNMFVRRIPFFLCGGFDETLVTCEDYDLSLRLTAWGEIYTDGSIVATHYGEASSLSHFFQKELWRGVSNLRGISRHGVKLSELPSICLPFLHCLLFAVLVAVLVLGESLDTTVVIFVVAVFFGWQSLLFLLSLMKYYRGSLSIVAQIFILLNVYYLARGVACLRQA